MPPPDRRLRNLALTIAWRNQKIELWRGRTVFPGPLQAVEYQGGPVLLYYRQFTPRGGLHISVDFSYR